MTTWKPGDVALVTSESGRDLVAFVRPRKTANNALEFVYDVGGYDMVDDLAPGWTVRPLVVIDPESADDVKRLSDELDKALRRLYPETYGNAPELDSLDDIALTQAALREFANPTPPKPAEPTGLGAVVEDEFTTYVRVAADTYGWRSRTAGGWLRWSDFDAVRVLSEGVTP